MKNGVLKVLAISILLVGIITLIISYVIDKMPQSLSDVRAKVIEIDQNIHMDTSNNTIKVKIISGRHKGEIIPIEDVLTGSYKDNAGREIKTKIGDQLFIHIEENNDGSIKSANEYDYVRYNQLAVIITIFLLLLIIIGGMKGIRSLITLILTVLSIIKIIIPSIGNGVNPMFITTIVCIGLLIVNLLIVSGLNRKTYAAIIGTVFGVLCSGILTFIVGNRLKVIGVTSEDAQALTLLFQGHQLNFKGILFSGMMLGTLGALIDIGISIASAMAEIKNNNNLSKGELIKSGMNIGRDIIGAMSNTLILASAGGAIVLMLIISSYDLSFIEIINQDVVVSEVLRVLIGSIGLMLSIPFTVLAMAELSTRFE